MARSREEVWTQNGLGHHAYSKRADLHSTFSQCKKESYLHNPLPSQHQKTLHFVPVPHQLHPVTGRSYLHRNLQEHSTSRTVSHMAVVVSTTPPPRPHFLPSQTPLWCCQRILLIIPFKMFYSIFPNYLLSKWVAARKTLTSLKTTRSIGTCGSGTVHVIR